MIGNMKYFRQLKGKYTQFHIELGDDGKYASKGVGIVSFERDSRSPLHLRDVIYVLRQKKNLVSIATLEVKGYDVIFSRGKAYPRHLASGAVTHKDLRVKNLYRLQIDTCATLSSKAGGGKQSRDVGELWHRRMEHLHHGVLIFQQIATGLPTCSFH